MARTPEAGQARNQQLRVRVTREEKAQAQRQRTAAGFSDDSSYLRSLIRADGKKKPTKDGDD